MDYDYEDVKGHDWGNDNSSPLDDIKYGIEMLKGRK